MLSELFTAFWQNPIFVNSFSVPQLYNKQCLSLFHTDVNNETV